MYSQNELSRRVARLASTKLFALGVEHVEQQHYPEHVLCLDTAEIVEAMEIQATLAAKRFLELGEVKNEWGESDDIEDIMLSQEYYDLRDMFLFLPEDMADDYFKGLDQRPFLEILIYFLEERT